jgi:hypothetical protein
MQTGKRAPIVLPASLGSLVSLPDDGWPITLSIPTGAGLMTVLWAIYPDWCANEGRCAG